MDSGVAIIVFLLVAIAIFIGKRVLSSPSPDATTEGQRYVYVDEAIPYAEEDARFESALMKRMGPQITKHFYTKVVGITFKNPDGVTGERLISRCQQFYFLQLVPEPTNQYDPHAIAVCLKDGSRIGHLNARTAEEVSKDITKGGQWQACVKFAKAKTSREHGCLVLCLMRMTGSDSET